MRPTKKFLTIALLLVIVSGVLSACASTDSTQTTTSTAKVVKVTVTSIIETSGNLSAARLSELSWGTAGVVGSVNVKLGDKVKEDDVLAELRLDTVSSDIIKAEANLTLAQQDLALVSHSKLTLAEAQQAVIDARKNVEEAEILYDALNYPRASDTLIENTEAQVWEAEDLVASTYKRFKEVKSLLDGDPKKTAAQLDYTNALLSYNELVATLNWYNSKPTEADYEKAKITLDVARATLDDARRARDLVKDGQNPATVQDAEASVSAYEAQTNLMRVLAPFDGEIIAVMTKAGDSAADGDIAFVIVDKDSLRVTVQVDESEIGAVAVGNPASITLESVSAEVLTGKVTSVNPVGKTVSGLVQYDVVVDVDPTDQPILFGVTVSVQITTGDPSEELAVPLNAVMNDGVSEYVTVLDPTGNTYYVEVVSGDLVNSLVVVSPKDQLNEGDTVVVDSTASTSSSSSNDAGGPPDGGMMIPGGG